jgi:hypothetical protein
MEEQKKDGGNIWGSKFSMFGLIVILFFISLVVTRSCMLGIPVGEVLRNQDTAPAATDSLNKQQ